MFETRRRTKNKRKQWLDRKLIGIEPNRQKHRLKQFLKKIKAQNNKKRTKIRGVKVKLDEGRIWKQYYKENDKEVKDENKINVTI